MSPREIEVLEAIRRHYAKYGVPPTVRYIMAQTQIPSNSTVFYYYRRLVLAKKIILAGSPGSQLKPVPVELHQLIRQMSV
jgi:SOS-response transcriptional repressor LexA